MTEAHKGVDRDTIGEISRLAVSKEYRRRAIDNALFEAGSFVPNALPRYMDDGRDIRRHCEHELVRGLYLLLYHDSKQRGLTHWYAVMAKGLYIILKRWGIPFHQIGAAKDYHGFRAPYLVSIETVEQTLEKKNPDLLEKQEGILPSKNSHFGSLSPDSPFFLNTSGPHIAVLLLISRTVGLAEKTSTRSVDIDMQLFNFNFEVAEGPG